MLWHLEVFNYRNAADGPGDFALLEALASTENGSEDEVTKATAQIGRLEEIFTIIFRDFAVGKSPRAQRHQKGRQNCRFR